MKANRIFFVLLALASLLSFSIARGDDSIDALKARAEQRYPQIRQAKDQGKIGEVWNGVLDYVDSAASQDATLKQLVDDENSDRGKLYALIAAKTNSPVEEVAKRAGQRNFDNAHAGDFLKDSSGAWHRK